MKAGLIEALPFSLYGGDIVALTLAEIIAEADERYPNALTNDSKIRKINTREQELFRTVFKRKTATQMDIVSGQFLYPLGFSKSKINHVIVNGTRYGYEEIDNEESDKTPYLYTYENSIGLYPTPDQSISGGLFIHHYAVPPTYEVADLDVSPSLDVDFHMLHVFGLIMDMAGIDYRDDVVNMYMVQYNELLKEFKRSINEPEIPPMRVE